ncbi:hypothetical protein QTP88_007794 [Uroleucon formosanum]
MVAIYISPNQKMANIIQFINKAFLVYSHEGAALYGGDEDTYAMIMSGDFNFNFASSDSAPLVTLLRDKFSLQLNNDLTISTTKSGTTIDPIFTQLDYTRLAEKHLYGAPLSPGDAAAACSEAIAWLTETCDDCMPSSGKSTKKQPVPINAKLESNNDLKRLLTDKQLDIEHQTLKQQVWESR